MTAAHRTHVALWVSGVGHPFVLLLAYVLVGAATVLPLHMAAQVAAVVLVGGVLPMLAFLHRQVRLGRTDFDVSTRERRGPVYALGLVLGLGLIAFFRFTGAPPQLLASLGGGFALVMAAALCNPWLKVSVHCAFAGFVAVGFLALAPWAGWLFVLLGVGIAWSRLELRRHTPKEVTCGLLLGTLTAAMTLLTLA